MKIVYAVSNVATGTFYEGQHLRMAFKLCIVVDGNEFHKDIITEG